MSASESAGRRRIDATRRREAGEASRRETRRRLVQAAGELFAEHGYVAATVSAIARRAGVSLQTLYLAAGSKRELLRAFMETSLTGDETPIAQRPWVSDLAHGGIDAPDPGEQIRALARRFRELAERSALAWGLYAEAAATDPEIASDWAALQGLRRETFEGLLRRVPPSALRSGLSPARAADTAWVIASPESYDLLVRRAGYSLDELEAWVADTLAAALLASPGPSAA